MQSTFAAEQPAFDVSEIFDNPDSKKQLNLALVEDDAADVRLFSILLSKTRLANFTTQHFQNIDSLLASEISDFDIIVLDRFIQNVGLSEGRIREVKAMSPHAGIIMHTGSVSPGIRALAAQEGAMAVIEKGSLNGQEMELLLITAAGLGAKISN